MKKKGKKIEKAKRNVRFLNRIGVLEHGGAQGCGSDARENPGGLSSVDSFDAYSSSTLFRRLFAALILLLPAFCRAKATSTLCSTSPASDGLRLTRT